MSQDLYAVDVARALASSLKGLSLAQGMAPSTQASITAMQREPCMPPADVWFGMQHKVHVCPAEGLIHWQDPAKEDATATQTAENDVIMDALLAPVDDTAIWARVPGGTVRRIVSRHYRSKNVSACGGANPLVFRLHYYCGGAQADSAILHTLRQAPPSTLHGEPSSPSWLGRSPRSIDSLPRDAFVPRCQLDGFVELPSLCRVPPFDDTTPQRMGALIEQVYPQLSGHTSGGDEHDERLHGDPKALTYGELELEGMLQLIDAFEGVATLTPTDVVVDVGSGVGKFVLAVAMRSRARSVGIEVVRERAERAATALKEARRAGLLTAAEADRVELLEDDATRPGALSDTTTFVFLSNLCFSPDLNIAVADALMGLPQLRCVAALRELPAAALSKDLPSPHDENRKFALLRTLRVRTTWDDHTRLHLYCRGAVSKSSLSLSEVE
jgi:hypothetical protein